MKVRVKLVRSTIGRPKDQRDTVRALGLRKLNHEVEHELNPAIQGMLTKVSHLLVVEELK